MKLGILYKDDRIINHRSFVKVLINPILRYFGYCIATLYDKDKEEIGGICIKKQERVKKIKWNFDHNDYDIIIKKRLLI